MGGTTVPTRAHWVQYRDKLPVLPAAKPKDNPLWAVRPAPTPVMVEFFTFPDYRLCDASKPVPRDVFDAAIDVVSFEFNRQTGGVEVADEAVVAAVDAELRSRGTYGEYLAKMAKKSGNAVAVYNRRHFEYRTARHVGPPRSLIDKQNDIIGRCILQAVNSHVPDDWELQPYVVTTGPLALWLTQHKIEPIDVFATTPSPAFEKRLAKTLDALPADDIPPLAMNIGTRPLVLVGESAGRYIATEYGQMPPRIIFGDGGSLGALSHLVADMPTETFVRRSSFYSFYLPGRRPPVNPDKYEVVDGVVKVYYTTADLEYQLPENSPGAHTAPWTLVDADSLIDAVQDQRTTRSDYLLGELETGAIALVHYHDSAAMLLAAQVPREQLIMLGLDDAVTPPCDRLVVLGQRSADFVIEQGLEDRVVFADHDAALILMGHGSAVSGWPKYRVALSSPNPPHWGRVNPGHITAAFRTQKSGEVMWWVVMSSSMMGGGKWGANTDERRTTKTASWRSRKRRAQLASDGRHRRECDPASIARKTMGRASDYADPLGLSEDDTATTVSRRTADDPPTAHPPVTRLFMILAASETASRGSIIDEEQAAVDDGWWDDAKKYHPSISRSAARLDATMRAYDRLLAMLTAHTPRTDAGVVPVRADQLMAIAHTARRNYPGHFLNDQLVRAAYDHYVKSLLDTHTAIHRPNANLTCGLSSPEGTHSTAMEDLANDGQSARNQFSRATGVIKRRKLDMVAGVVKRHGPAVVLLSAAAVVAAPVLFVGVKIAGLSWAASTAIAVYKIRKAAKQMQNPPTDPLPKPTPDLFARPLASTIPVLPSTEAVHLGKAKDESNLDPKHIVYTHDPPCRAKPQKGATILGGVFAYPQVAASCLCNAHNALYLRHGAKQKVATKTLMSRMDDPLVVRLRRRIAAEYPSKLCDAELHWLRHIGYDVKETKWPMGKAVNILRSVYRNRVMPGVVKAFIKREVGKASIDGEPLTKARLIQAYANDATAELYAREFTAFQKALCAVATVDEPFELYPGVSFTMGSGLTATQLSDWANKPAEWHLESDATNWDSSINRDLFDAKGSFLHACDPALADFALKGHTVNGYVTYDDETLKYRLYGTIKSGFNDTTSGNSLLNALVTCTALHDAGATGTVIVAGDDMLAKMTSPYSHEVFDNILANITAYGLVPKAGAFRTIDESSFISGAFLTVGGRTRFMPQLGRQLAKLWSTTRDVRDKDVGAYKNGVVKGFGSVADVPCFREFLIKDYGTSKIIRVNDEYKTSYDHDLRNGPDDAHWVGALCERYDVSRVALDDFRDYLRAIPPLGAYACSHPVATVIVRRDCGDACDRVGNLRAVDDARGSQPTQKSNALPREPEMPFKNPDPTPHLPSTDTQKQHPPPRFSERGESHAERAARHDAYTIGRSYDASLPVGSCKTHPDGVSGVPPRCSAFAKLEGVLYHRTCCGVCDVGQRDLTEGDTRRRCPSPSEQGRKPGSVVNVEAKFMVRQCSAFSAAHAVLHRKLVTGIINECRSTLPHEANAAVCVLDCSASGVTIGYCDDPPLHTDDDREIQAYRPSFVAPGDPPVDLPRRRTRGQRKRAEPACVIRPTRFLLPDPP